MYDRLLVEGADTLYISSGLVRARETLELLFPASRDNAVVIPELGEYRFGAYEGQSYDQLKDDRAYRRWIDDQIAWEAKRRGGLVRCPNGENRRMFERRVAKGISLALHEAVTRRTAQIVLVSHGGVIASRMNACFPDRRNFYQWQPRYGRGYLVRVEDGRWVAYREV
jgi:alpha-ribazole phosphatase